MIRADLSKDQIFRGLYLLSLLVLLVCLPLSKYIASASQLFLAIVWLAEGRFADKWRRFRQRPAIAVFMVLYLVHLAGLAWSADLPAGLHDLKVKLPLLALPLILGTIEPLNSRELKIVLGGFVAGVLVGSLVSLSIILGISHIEYLDDRQSSLFISHIRFALMINLAIFILAWYAAKPHLRLWQRLLMIAAGLYLVAFLFIFKSLTGVVVVIAGGLIVALYYGLRSGDLLIRWFVVVGAATLPVFAAFYLTGQVDRFYTVREGREHLDSLTVRGNPYYHDLQNSEMENGYYVYQYLCDQELAEAWAAVSEIPYGGLDLKGQELKYTLIRYLTSLGLRKDAHGVSQLTEEDIRWIEKGFASSIYREPGRFRIKIYELIWELDHYRKGGNPGGHSVTQRLEFLRTGWAIFRDQPLTGVGTGDVQAAFDVKYEEIDSRLPQQYRLRAHNQFLTFAIATGLIGALLILIALILPVFLEKRHRSYLVLMFLLVSLLSMLNEDTLETQAGVAFFAIFYSLFVFCTDDRNETPRPRTTLAGDPAGQGEC
jgi:O-antigen ligase